MERATERWKPPPFLKSISENPSPASCPAAKTWLDTLCGETGSRETNRWLARRRRAEAILAREKGRATAEQQRREKVRRQKRRRSRRQKQKMLADKHAHSELKARRRKVDPDE